MSERIAIIPARGGSKRIPDKNIKELCGRPIIGYILEAARKSDLFDIIHVSTDSERIANIVDELGFPVHFMRPATLADDNTPIMPVLKYVVDKFISEDRKVEMVAMLMPCAPLVEAEDLRAAYDMYSNQSQSQPVLGIAPFSAPIEWAFSLNDNKSLVPVQPGKFSIRSQDLATSYYDAGVFCYFPSEVILESEGAGSDDSFLGFPLERYKAVDIDEPEDWKFVELLQQGKLASKKIYD